MNQAVIGLGFGDEGKGFTVDYLCSKSPDSLVVRFSGGHQCGHTVVTDKYRHVFSNFGSGTLKGNPTYWSEYCTVEPRGLLREYDLLVKNGFDPVIYIDKKCPVTTPYDIYVNQMVEDQRACAGKNHGSVGVGFGHTIQREEDFYSLTFMDIFCPNIFEAKVSAIRDYYGKENVDYTYLNEFKCACYKIRKTKNIILTEGIPKRSSYIFEGSQGLLLDQHHGFFPNVTRANTGLKNIYKQWNLLIPRGEVFLVTRAYQTRHGNGFMTNEQAVQLIKENPIETNKEHPYQGSFRRSRLDVSLLEYGINKEELRYELNKNLVITCLDHIVDDYSFTYNEETIHCENGFEFITKIGKILKIENIYYSRSDNSKYLDFIGKEGF